MNGAELLAVHRDAPWLPPGSSAEVWACNAAVGPDPAAIVRLLLTRHLFGREPEFFCVDSPKGLDLPSRFLGNGDRWERPAEGIAALSSEVTGQSVEVLCVGYVRNVVPFPDDSYSLFTPNAHVPVYRAQTPAAPIVHGERLTIKEGRNGLTARHWWRIVDHSL